jgi:hypothetical protein
MPKYKLTFCKQKFLITADNPKEAREKAAKKLSYILGLKVPLSYIIVHKKPYKE